MYGIRDRDGSHDHLALDNEFIARGNAQRISLSALIFFFYIFRILFAASASSAVTIESERGRAPALSKNWIEIKFLKITYIYILESRTLMGAISLLYTMAANSTI